MSRKQCNNLSRRTSGDGLSCFDVQLSFDDRDVAKSRSHKYWAFGIFRLYEISFWEGIRVRLTPRQGAILRQLLGAGALAVIVFFFVFLGSGWSLRLKIVFFALFALFVLGVFFFGRRMARDIFARHFEWVPAVAGVVSYPFWLWYSNKLGDVNVNFFESSAQVLPVVLLSVVIDVRRSTSLNSRQLLVPIVIVILGEIIALDSTAFEQGSRAHESFALVCSALITAVVALLFAVLAAPDEGQADA